MKEFSAVAAYLSAAAFVWWCAVQLLSWIPEPTRYAVLGVAVAGAWAMWVSIKIALPRGTP